MRPGIHGVCVLATAMLLGVVISSVTWAGDYKEAKQKVPAGVETIFHRVWRPSPADFPLKWHLHKDGVVNNNATGGKSPRLISNEEVRKALEASFQRWADLETANISIENGPDTDTAKAACDLENIVTWSDEDSFPEENDRRIARGLTFFYAGPKIEALDDTNRINVPCSAGQSRPGIIEHVDLPKDKYPNGMPLETGTILDTDLVWNSQVFDFVTTFGDEPQNDVLDIQAIATHEFGHMLGLTHTSLKAGGDVHGMHTPTMAVVPVPPDGTGNPDRKLQLNIRSLSPDDIAAASRAYPGEEFEILTGEIKGRVTMNGRGVEGVRVWLYDANAGIINIKDNGDVKFDNESPSNPLYESFTATGKDFELMAGDYMFKGIPPGRYFVCVMPWYNNIPHRKWSTPCEGTFNWSVASQLGNPKDCEPDDSVDGQSDNSADRRSNANTDRFNTACFVNFHKESTGWPEMFDIKDRIQAIKDRIQAVRVVSGETTADVNIAVPPSQ